MSEQKIIAFGGICGGLSSEEEQTKYVCVQGWGGGGTGKMPPEPEN